LFCQRTQQGILENFLRVLDGDGFSSEPLPEDTHNWSHWPTTRQGDECEKRIENLECGMNKLFQFENPRHARITPIFNYEEQDDYLLMRKHENSHMDCDNDSISTHSSIDLADDNSTHSSMPDLMEIQSVDSDKRIRNSYELCGNN